MKKIILSFFVVSTTLFLLAFFMLSRNVEAQVIIPGGPSAYIVNLSTLNADSLNVVCIDISKCQGATSNSSTKQTYTISPQKPFILSNGFITSTPKYRVDYSKHDIFTQAWADRYGLSSAITTAYFDEKKDKGSQRVQTYGPSGKVTDTKLVGWPTSDIGLDNIIGSDKSSVIDDSGQKKTYSNSYSTRKLLVTVGNPKYDYIVTLGVRTNNWHLMNQKDVVNSVEVNPTLIVDEKENACWDIKIAGSTVDYINCSTTIIVRGNSVVDLPIESRHTRLMIYGLSILGLEKDERSSKSILSPQSDNFAAVYNSLYSVKPITIYGWGFATATTSTNILKFTNDVGRTSYQSVVGTGNDLRIDFTPNVPPGNYWVDLTNSITGSTSDVVQLNVVSSNVVVKTVSIITRLGGRALNTVEANSCVTGIFGPTGNNTGSCVRTIDNQAPGSYSLVWYGGFPTGSDITKNPIVTPAQVLINSGLTFYMDFQATTSPAVVSCTISTPTITGSGPYNVKVPVSITNGPPMTTYYLYRSSSSAPSYVKVGYITTGSSGSTNIAISDPSAISADTYSYTILGNKVDAPKCSPAQTVTVGVVTPIPLTSTLTLSSNLNSSYKVGDILPIKWTSTGVDKVNINLLNFKGSTIIRTIATVPASLGQYDWKVGDIDFSNDSTYIISITDASNPALKSKSGKIDFIPAPIPVTVLPWTSIVAVSLGQTLNYTLNWSGGPLDKSWKVFAHMVKDDNSHTFTGGDFWPNPTTDKWTGNISTASTVTIPAGTPPGTYKVMVGLYDGAPRVTTLIAGTNVLAENPTQYRYQVGTITITEPILKQGASIWDAIKALFGF